MPSESYPWPFLPPELEREIFENAAALHPESIPSLLPVSHRVHEWTERIKYRTAGPSHLSAVACNISVLLQAIRSNARSASFFRDRVQHLFFDDSEDQDQEEILSVCGGIQSLILFQTVQRAPSLGAIRPRRLSLYLQDLDQGEHGQHISSPPLTSVTHLDLLNTGYSNVDKVMDI
ncbi:hypothetical protein K438DRAFT_382504 [Mycena galopus ATCC 62051]|nr:hypothetical protein K438DRAFT_382504 [Mycena galopus ATCC 62051]